MKRLIYLSIAVSMTIFTMIVVVESQTMALGLVNFLIFGSISFWSVWQAFWGHEQKPHASKIERRLALLWLFFRRLVCGIGVVFFTVASFYLLTQRHLLEGISLIVTSVFCIWFGIVGSSSNDSLPARPKQDLRTYKKRKQRYGWRL